MALDDMCEWVSHVKGLGHTAALYQPGKYGRNVAEALRTHGSVYRTLQKLLLGPPLACVYLH